MEPDRDSVAYVEQQTAMEYGVPSFVVSDEAWAESGGSAPAFSAGGQIYFKETIPEKNRGMLAPHELTHIMKQVKYQMYLDFTARTAEMLDKSTYEAAILIERSAKHRGIDVFGKDGYLDIKKLNALDAKNRLTLFDELNATLYGHIGSGNMGGLRPYLEAAFHDFAAYAEELEAIHEQFKQHN